MTRDRIVFWQEAVSPHQAACIRALAERLPAGRTIWVVQQPPTPERLRMGWDRVAYGRTTVVMAPDSAAVDGLLATDSSASVHIFSGVAHNPAIAAALRQGLGSPQPLVGFLSEARDWFGWKGLLRRIHSLGCERRYRSRLAFVLAMGDLGVGWYRRCGFRADRLYPFGYVVDHAPCRAADLPAAPGRSVHVAFIGSLYAGKRVDLLLRALAACRRHSWRLSLFGDGDQRDRLGRLADELGVHDRVVFHGNTANANIRRALDGIDVTVLPSRWDGWGAVVNESLMSGVPVICSDRCGASTLIRPGWNGDVFGCGQVRDLRRALEPWLACGAVPPERRAAIRRWSACIGGEAMADYLLDVIRHAEAGQPPRPAPPWRAI